MVIWNGIGKQNIKDLSNWLRRGTSESRGLQNLYRLSRRPAICSKCGKDCHARERLLSHTGDVHNKTDNEGAHHCLLKREGSIVVIMIAMSIMKINNNMTMDMNMDTDTDMNMHPSSRVAKLRRTVKILAY